MQNPNHDYCCNKKLTGNPAICPVCKQKYKKQFIGEYLINQGYITYDARTCRYYPTKKGKESGEALWLLFPNIISWEYHPY